MEKKARGRMFLIAGVIVIIGFFLPFETKTSANTPFPLFSAYVYPSLFNNLQYLSQDIYTTWEIGTFAVGAVGILFLLFGYILIDTNITSTISTTFIKILGSILSLGVVGFLYSEFISFGVHDSCSFFNTGPCYFQATPNWGFYLIVVGGIIGTITLFIPDKEDKGNT